MAVIAFVGFGELGASLADGLARSGAHELRAFTRPRPDGTSSARLARPEATKVRQCPSLEDALAGAKAVIAVVPGHASLEVARQCAALLGPDVLYVDLAATSVAVKHAGEAAIAASGARYVDGAVLGTVSMSGSEVPIVASGSGAEAWRSLVQADGLNIEVLDGPVGDATLIKLLRSVYLKGRDALIAEMMLAARRYGLDARVAASIQGPGERVPFPELSDRVLKSLALHAGRRADELEASSEVLRAAGVAPRLSQAGTEVLRALAGLGLREEFGGERPADADRVLALIDERSPPAPPGI